MLTALQSLPEKSCFLSMKSPVGELGLVASDQGLHVVLWTDDLESKAIQAELKKLKRDPKHPILMKARQQLEEYFAGRRQKFDLPLRPTGTDFQLKAWRELRRIPYGKTISYFEQAKRLGDIKKARAVGTANSRNPLSIIVPCHRVIAKSGALSGFGGGIEAKRFLLDLERRG